MTEPFVKEALDYSIDRVHHNLEQLHDFPELAKDGSWATVTGGGWVGGHWTGLIWLAYAHTREPALLAEARGWSERLAPRQNDLTTHDLGFLFELSYILGAKLTGDDALKAPALQAARSLIRRFNARGGYLQAWRGLDASPDWRGRAIIDTLMNVYLLYWASLETGDATFAQIATTHANTALKRQVRADWTTAHVMDFDPDSGEFIKQDTHQGLSPTSCWSRGQAWGVHGFADCYRWTQDETYLNASRKLAETMLRRSPPDHVPFWDYDSPLIPNDVRDSSAGSILASGLLHLAALEKDPTQGQRWRGEAVTILESLWENYSSRGTIEPSILIHATRSKPAGMMDSGLIYGDYYFVEALTRLSAPEKLPL
jgi:unsaturated chondroitin disaccharide hydrolase